MYSHSTCLYIFTYTIKLIAFTSFGMDIKAFLKQPVNNHIVCWGRYGRVGCVDVFAKSHFKFCGIFRPFGIAICHIAAMVKVVATQQTVGYCWCDMGVFVK